MTKWEMKLVPVIAIAIGASGCTLVHGFGEFSDEEADAGQAGTDAGRRDAQVPPDAETPLDSGPRPDGGPADGGPPDAGPLDGGPPDGGPPDAGPLDGGPPPDPVWEPFIRIGQDDSADEVNNSEPRVAISRNGTALVIYYDNGDVWVRRYVHATRTFDPLHRVSETSSQGANPRVAMDDDGNAVVAWRGTTANPSIYVRRFEASLGWPGGWSAIEEAQPPEGTGRSYNLSSLDMTTDGHIVVAWSAWIYSPSPAVDRAYLRLYVRGSGWAPRVVVSGASTSSSGIAAGVARIGTTLRVPVAWTERIGTTLGMRGAIYSYDLTAGSGSLGSSTLLESSTFDALAPRMGVDAAGDATLLFSLRRSGSGGDVKVARHTGGAWSSVSAFNPDGSLGYDPVLSVADSGEALVVWRECSPCKLVARQLTGGAWRPVLQVTSADPGYTAAAVRDDGRAIAVWSQPMAGVPSIFGSELDALGWTAPQPLEDESSAFHGSMADVAFGPQFGLAVWQREADGVGGLMFRKIAGALFR